MNQQQYHQKEKFGEVVNCRAEFQKCGGYPETHEGDVSEFFGKSKLITTSLF